MLISQKRAPCGAKDKARSTAKSTSRLSPVATYHASVKVGQRGKAASHAAYIARIDKYADLRSGELLELTESGNLPAWSSSAPTRFWRAADEHERANGNAYREFELALPRELLPVQRAELVRDFVAQELGDRHAYTFAIHNPVAALAGGEQPHAHVMFSDRKRDGIERDPEQYFRRYNAKSPEKGGCQKEAGSTATSQAERRADRKEKLIAFRERWAELTNAHLERHGHVDRVDHRSLAERGIERAPERHFGGRGVRELLRTGEIVQLLEQRKAEGELERAQSEVRASVLDLSGDVAAARRDQAQREQRERLSQPDVVAARAAWQAYQENEKAEAARKDTLEQQATSARDAFRQNWAAEKQQREDTERTLKKERDNDRGFGR